MRKKYLLDDDLDFIKYSEILPRCRICKHYLGQHYCEFYDKVIFIEILGLCTEEDSFEEGS
jgi:hypothetical protein